MEKTICSAITQTYRPMKPPRPWSVPLAMKLLMAYCWNRGRQMSMTPLSSTNTAMQITMPL